MSKIKRYYGFEYASGVSTTTGQPNSVTGRLSIAGNLTIFTDRAVRDEWVQNGETTSDMQGNCRISVKLIHVRDLMLGSSVSEMNEHIDSMTDVLVDS